MQLVVSQSPKQQSLLNKLLSLVPVGSSAKYQYNFPLAGFQVKIRLIRTEGHHSYTEVVMFHVDPAMLEEDFVAIVRNKIMEEAHEPEDNTIENNIEMREAIQDDIEEEMDELEESAIQQAEDELQEELNLTLPDRVIDEIEIVPLQPSPEFKIAKVLFANRNYEVEWSGLRKLFLEGHNIKEFPVEICRLVNLQELYLGYNFIKIIPKEIESLTNLITLHMQRNHLEKISRSISTLTNLKSLWLSSNNLLTIPIEMGNMKLIGLHLHQNKLTVLPLELKKMTTLQKFDISDNLIKTLNMTPENMTSLVKLNMKNNRFTDLSGAFWANLVNLTELEADNNVINSISNEIGTLTTLTLLHLSHNQLSSVPSVLGNLVNLTSLSLAHNRNIQSLPTELFVHLNKLIRLDLTGNKIQSIPPEISNMTCLLYLKLGSNQISQFPQEVTFLTQLVELNLSSNQLTLIRPDIENLVSLTELDLQKNKLKSLPTTVGNLVKLKKLYLSDNLLVSIPPSFSSLTSLTALQLHYNPELNVLPRELLCLTQLQEISAANIYINDHDQEIQILREDDTLLKQYFNITRSAPHRLFVFGLTHFPSNVNHHARFIEEGLITDILHMTLLPDVRIQYEACRVIAYLSEIDHFQVKLFEEKALTVLFRLLSTDAEVRAKVKALETIGNMAFNESNKKQMYQLYGIDYFKDLVLNAPDNEIRRKAKRVLSIFGIHDHLYDDSKNKRGVRILAIDGGGTKGLVAVEILKKIEQITNRKICDMFDLICGTSTGGIIASLLGIRGANAQRCEDLYLDLCGKVFAHTEADTSKSWTGWSRMVGGMNIIRTGSFYRADVLEDNLITHVGTEPMIDTQMDDVPKVFCVSTLVSTFPPEIFLFRNYNYPVNLQVPSRYSGTCRKLLHRALRASTAAPSYFDEMVDGDKRFQDGGLMCNNPTAAALHEAKKLWPDRNISCILSLGTGKEPPKIGRTGLQATLLTLIESATNVERIDEVLSDTLDESIYFRFNPENAIFECKLDETKREKLEAFQAAAREFIEKNIDKLQRVADILMSDM